MPAANEKGQKMSKAAKPESMIKTVSKPSGDPNALDVYAKEGEDPNATITKKLLNPSVSAAATIREFRPSLKELPLNVMCNEMDRHAENAQNGDLASPEAMLATQAHALDAIFNTLAQRAALNIGTHMHAADTYLRMALKAQAQCRTTLEALAEIKYPKSATFIKQANIASQQQVNNAQTAPRTQEKNITPTNELLTESAHATLDTGRTGAAIGINPQLETMAAVNGAKH